MMFPVCMCACIDRCHSHDEWTGAQAHARTGS
jgi:hypothetical protein